MSKCMYTGLPAEVWIGPCRCDRCRCYEIRSGRRIRSLNFQVLADWKNWRQKPKWATTTSCIGASPRFMRWLASVGLPERKDKPTAGYLATISDEPPAVTLEIMKQEP